MNKEHTDLYIAFAVGGLGLVLILLYVFSNSTAPAATQTNANGGPLPTVGAVSPPDLPQTAYNYNIVPFDPAPGIAYPRESIPANENGCGCGGGSGCGPQNGQQFFNTNVSQFMTLVGYGNQAGA